VPSSPGESLVEYSTEVRVGAWMPGFLQSMMGDNGMSSAPDWVRTVSVRRFTEK
jgi:hypothetical protein